MQDNLEIPYGISDFKRIRTEGYYYIDKTGYIPMLEQSGSFLFFVRPRLDSYMKVQSQLLPSLAKDTTLHQIAYQFKGSELIRAEQIAEEQM